MADRIIDLGSNHRILVDDTANTWTLQFYDSADAAWKDMLSFDTANQRIRENFQLADNIKMLLGSDGDYSIRYDSTNDAFYIKDEVNGTEYKLPKNVSMDISAHHGRHEYGGADAIATDGLHFTQIDKSLGTEVSKSVAGSSTLTIDKGAYYVRADSGVNVEYSTDGGTTWVALSIPCFIVSDGSNVRFNNTNTAAANGYLTPISS